MRLQALLNGMSAHTGEVYFLSMIRDRSNLSLKLIKIS